MFSHDRIRIILFYLIKTEFIMFGKILIVVLLLLIVFNLFRGLYFLVRDQDRGKKNVVNALSWRIGLSILLFLLIWVLGYFGVIELHSLPQIVPDESVSSDG